MRAKLVEQIDFERGQEPKDAMSIGLNPIEIVSPISTHPVYGNQLSDSDKIHGHFENFENYMWWNYYDINGTVYSSEDLMSKWVKFEDKIYKIPNWDELTKLRAEREKLSENIEFERGIEPRDAMKIGMMNLIRNFLESEGKLHLLRDEKWFAVLYVCLKNNKFDFADFILDGGIININAVHTDNNSLRIFAYKENFKAAKYLINKGANLEKAIHDAERFDERKTLSNLYSLRRKLKESIEFERGVEPNKAMNIGIDQLKSHYHKKFVEDLKKSFPKLNINKQDIKRISEPIHPWIPESKYWNLIYLDKLKSLSYNERKKIKEWFDKYPLFDFLSIKKERLSGNEMMYILRFKWNPRKKMNESIEFEQRLEPYKAMNIGRKNLIKNIDLSKDDDNLYSQIINISKDYEVVIDSHNMDIERSDGSRKRLEKGDKLSILDYIESKLFEFRHYVKIIINDDINEPCKINLWNLAYSIKIGYLDIYDMNESIDFERGIEPHKAMKVGDKWKIWNVSKRELFKIIVVDVFKSVDHDSKFLDETVKKRGYKDISAYYDTLFDEENGEFLDKNEDEIIKKAEQLLRKAIEKTLEKYPLKDLDSVASTFFEIFTVGAPGMQFEQDVLYNIDDRYLRESIEFERGIEPSKAMNIGMTDERRLQQAIEKYDIPDNALNYDGVNAPEGGVFLNIRNYKIGDVVNHNGEPVVVIIKTKHDIIATRFNNLQARFHESIEFERGIEPREAMRIGRKDLYYKDKLDELAKFFGFKETKIKGIVIDSDDPNFNDVAQWEDPNTEIHDRGIVFYEDVRYEDEDEDDNLRFQVFSRNGDKEENKRISTWLKPEKWKEFFHIDKNIDESIEFERGLEPSRAMTIGYGDAAPYIVEIDKLAKRLGFKKADDISIKQEDFCNDIMEWRRRPGEVIVLYKDLRNKHDNEEDNEYTFSIYYEGINDSGNTKVEYWLESGWRSFLDEVDESIEFERGLEPSRAMTIGRKAIAEKKAKEIDWDWYPQDEGLKEEVIDVVEHHGENIKVAKILTAKSYSGKDIQGIWKYYAVSSVGEPYLDDPSFYETSEEALQKTKDWIDDYLDEQGLNLRIYKKR